MLSEIKLTISQIGSCVSLFIEALRELGHIPRQMHRILAQCYQIGVKTLPIVLIMSFFIGAVLALQAGISMVEVSEFMNYLGSLVGESMCRELGPVITAFLLAGRVGSGITAELASMKVYQEVDALQTMNIPPTRVLVMPRLVAVALMMPVLGILSILVGWYGGMLVAKNTLFIAIEPEIYWRSLKEFVSMKDLIDGLIKTQIFGIVVILISCNTGLNTQGGPREIGVSVKRAVVSAMVMILLLDYFVTRFTI